MLLLGFNIGNDKYVIDTANVVEVIPLVRLKDLPGSHDGISGLLNYHGEFVPVVDISLLCNKTTGNDTLTTRIIISRYHGDKLLALKAEKVTEAMKIDKNAFTDSGIKVSEQGFLGDVTEHNSELLQMINIDQLLSEEVKDSLFPYIKQRSGSDNHVY